MPLFSYFLVVGSVLAALFFYAETVMVPRSLPFGARQRPSCLPSVAYTDEQLISAVADLLRAEK